MRVVKIIIEYERGYARDVFQERYVEIKAELEIYGSLELRMAFRKCIDMMQEEEYNLRSSPPSEDDGDFRHHNKFAEGLIDVIRREIDVLEKTL